MSGDGDLRARSLAALTAAQHWLAGLDPRRDGYEGLRREGLRHCTEGLGAVASLRPPRLGTAPPPGELVRLPRGEFLSRVRSMADHQVVGADQGECGYLLGLVAMSWARSGDLYCAAHAVVAAGSLGLWTAPLIRTLEHLLDRQEPGGWFGAGPVGEPGAAHLALVVTVPCTAALARFAATSPEVAGAGR